jgi:hypothetical protein
LHTSLNALYDVGISHLLRCGIVNMYSSQNIVAEPVVASRTRELDKLQLGGQ